MIVALLFVASIDSDAAALRELAKIESLLASNEQVQATQMLTGISRYLYAKGPVANCRPLKESLAGINRPKAVETYLQAVRDALQQAKHTEGCQNALLLGIAMQRQLAQLTPALRLRQQERLWAASGSPKNLPALDPLAWANFEAGQFGRAEELAKLQLEIAAKQDPMHQPDFFQHSARSLLGLIRLQGGSTAEAVTLLRQSLEVKPGMMMLASRPAVRLADALWKKGEKAAVQSYLEQAAAMPWTSPVSKSEVAKWLEEVKVGQDPSFFGVTGPVAGLK